MINSSCIIAAAGSGKRCNLNFNKILYKVDDRTILEHTISIFLDIDYINEIIIVVSNADVKSIAEI
jgi:2-C-methyl-D-erythritol 4-phosphate cytidylyltransferase